jgi:hypothetical protein
MAQNFGMTISHTGAGWNVAWSTGADAGDVVAAIAIGLCGAASGLSITPEEVSERALVLIASPAVRIREVWRPEPPGSDTRS